MKSDSTVEDDLMEGSFQEAFLVELHPTEAKCIRGGMTPNIIGVGGSGGGGGGGFSLFNIVGGTGGAGGIVGGTGGAAGLVFNNLVFNNTININVNR
jgi:hypothetical protein